MKTTVFELDGTYWRNLVFVGHMRKGHMLEKFCPRWANADGNIWEKFGPHGAHTDGHILEIFGPRWSHAEGARAGESWSPLGT